MKACSLAALLLAVVSLSIGQIPYTPEQVIASAKAVDVNALDPSLPSQRLEDWLQYGPPRVHVNWRVAETCDLKDPEIPYPICAKASFYREGEDGNKYGQQGQLLLQVGNSKDGIVGRPQILNEAISVYEGMFLMSGSSERLADLPGLLDLPVVTGNVEKLYLAIVAHPQIGIPTAPEMSILRRYLSKRLAAQLQTAQACQDDYRHRKVLGSRSSTPGWLKSGLFSGERDHSSPVNAVVHRKEKQGDGSFLVYVDLDPAEAIIKHGRGLPRAFYGGYTWQVAVRVISEDGRWVIEANTAAAEMNSNIATIYVFRGNQDKDPGFDQPVSCGRYYLGDLSDSQYLELKVPRGRYWIYADIPDTKLSRSQQQSALVTLEVEAGQSYYLEVSRIPAKWKTRTVTLKQVDAGLGGEQVFNAQDAQVLPAEQTLHESKLGTVPKGVKTN